jgi:hypothetical protein
MVNDSPSQDFQVGSRYRWYVVWLLFLVYVLNFVDYLADRFTNWRKDVRWQLWVPGIETLIIVPVALLAYTQPDRYAVIALLFISLVCGVLNPVYLADGGTATAAKMQGLRMALVIMVCVKVWSFVHYMLAARTIEQDSIKQ